MTIQSLKKKIEDSQDRLSKLRQQYADREKVVRSDKDSISMVESSGFSSLPKKIQNRYKMCGTDEDILYCMKAQYDTDSSALESKAAEINSRQTIIDKLKMQLDGLRSIIEIPAFRRFFDNWKKESIEYYKSIVSDYRRRMSEHYSALKTLEDSHMDYVSDANGLPVYEKTEYINCVGRQCFRHTYEHTPEWMKEMDSWNSYRKTTDMAFINRVDLHQPEAQLNEWLEDMVSSGAERRYEELVGRVTSLGGQVLDCSGLHIAGDGSINGIIRCSNGPVKVETVTAGGYNQDIIVNEKHGQCLHYRVLTKLLKKGN